ncbi:MAG: hypothetical protein GWM88_01910 [Pseudomonadales bacterium]|nr:hypothetical protein [Pseudomonadales bacterium]NIX06834.1 hypothetical protein [Pseudomonadales bacterium]
MAARFREDFGVEAELVGGRGGVFDVVVDGRTVYSKHDTGHFPDEAELIATLKG